MSLDAWLRVLQMAVLVGSVVVNVGLFLYARRDKRFVAFDEHVAKQEGAARAMEQRITVLETKMADMPSHDDLQEIRSLVAEVAEDVAATRGQITGINQTLHIIQSHLLSKSK